MPKQKPDEEINETETHVDDEVREYVEKMPGYQEYLNELRGDELNFGDY